MREVFYVLIHYLEPMFKIGISESFFESRLKNIQSNFGRLDLKNSWIVSGNGNKRWIETILKNALKHFRFDLKGTKYEFKDGKTEWFKIECLDEVLSMIKKISNLNPNDSLQLKQGIVLPDKPKKKILSKKEKAILKEKQKRMKAEEREKDRENRDIENWVNLYELLRLFSLLFEKIEGYNIRKDEFNRIFFAIKLISKTSISELYTKLWQHSFFYSYSKSFLICSNSQRDGDNHYFEFNLSKIDELICYRETTEIAIGLKCIINKIMHKKIIIPWPEFPDKESTFPCGVHLDEDTFWLPPWLVLPSRPWNPPDKEV